MSTLRETLAGHVSCGERYCDTLSGAARIEGCDYCRARVDAAERDLLAWVGARLAGARRDAAKAILADDIAKGRAADLWGDGADEPWLLDNADAALTVVRDALGVPVAPAGGEVAPGAAGGEIARESGAGGVRERNRRVIDHEIRTPMRGHDEDGECCRKAAEICEACPFLGCDSCEAEATRRANGEAK